MFVAHRALWQCALLAALSLLLACTEAVLDSTALDSATGPSTRDTPARVQDAGSSLDAADSAPPHDEPTPSLRDASRETRDATTTLRDASFEPVEVADAQVDGAKDAQSEAARDTGPLPVAPSYMLTIDAPAAGASVTSPVRVRGRGPGFLNVEVWDAQHTKPPLARATPAPDGSFEINVDVSALSSGPTSWTVHGWDSAPGATSSHDDSVVLPLTLQTPTMPPSSPVGGTPDPGTKYVPSGYMLAFSDEFTGSTLDTGKWNTLAPFGVHFFADSKQKQYFVPEAVTLNAGVVRFTARKSTGNTEGQPYSSGSITTNGTFTHGYFEARVKVPAGKGFWPAYWLTSSTRWPPEWDIFEIIDNVIFGYTHPISGGKCSFVEGAAGSDSTYMIASLYDTWHVYGFLWTASDLYWYVDGLLTEHYAVNAAAGANDPFWLNLSLQVGGDWPGDPNSTTPFPGQMDVDYVRVYQN
jgi:Glycosyl hydrolases family 16